MLELIALTALAYITAVFEQQIPCSFKYGFIVLGRFAVLDISHFIDDPAKSGNDVEQIEYDFGLWQFFLK